MASSPSSLRSLSPELTETIQIFVKNISGDSKSTPVRGRAYGLSHLPHDMPTSRILDSRQGHFKAMNHQLISSPVIPMTVPKDLTVENLANLLSARTSLPTADLRLVYAGKHLAPSSTLAESHITRDSTIHLASPLRGGMPPKKIRCSYKDCKEGAQRIIGDCGFCNGHYCGKHRLLEDHKCDGLEDVSWPFDDADPISALSPSPDHLSSALSAWSTMPGDSEGDAMGEDDESNVHWWLVGLNDQNLITDILREEQCKKQSHERNAAQLNAERTQVIKGI